MASVSSPPMETPHTAVRSACGATPKRECTHQQARGHRSDHRSSHNSAASNAKAHAVSKVDVAACAGGVRSDPRPGRAARAGERGSPSRSRQVKSPPGRSTVRSASGDGARPGRQNLGEARVETDGAGGIAGLDDADGGDAAVAVVGEHRAAAVSRLADALAVGGVRLPQPTRLEGAALVPMV